MIKDRVESKDRDGKVDISKRIFIKKAGAAVVVAAAGLTGIAISTSSDTINRKRANINYTNDDLRQERVMSQKQCVLMTDKEKKQMLNEILDNYYKELA